jgi:hypothetical protein
MSNLRRSVAGAAFGAALFLAGCGGMESGPVNLKATLSGAQEMPAVATAGTGSGTLTYDPSTKRLNWTVTYSGLSGPAAAAHFHGPAASGANAGVVVPIGSAGMSSRPPVRRR